MTDYALVLTDGLRLMHLAAMAVGLGTMVTTDLNMLRRAGDTITEDTLRTMELTHRLMAAALLAAWISGLALAVMRTGFDPANVTPKLLTKLVVVSALTATAVAVKHAVFPVLARLKGRSIIDAPYRDKIAMAVVASLSVSGWTSALILGASTAVKTAGWSTLLPAFCLVYATVMAIFFARAVTLHQQIGQERRLVARARIG